MFIAPCSYVTFGYALDTVRIFCVICSSYSVSAKSRSCCTRPICSVGARPTIAILFEWYNEKSYTVSGTSDIRLDMTGTSDRETMKGPYGVAVDSLV